MEISVALSAAQYTSVSADKSFLQQEYANLLSKKCGDYGVSNPFELGDESLREFFNEISGEWKARKRELFKEGQIESSQL